MGKKGEKRWARGLLVLSSALSVLIQLSLRGLEKYWWILLWVEILLGPSVSVLLIAVIFGQRGRRMRSTLCHYPYPARFFLVAMEKHLSYQVHNVLSKKQSFYITFFFTYWVCTASVLVSAYWYSLTCICWEELNLRVDFFCYTFSLYEVSLSFFFVSVNGEHKMPAYQYFV